MTIDDWDEVIATTLYDLITTASKLGEASLSKGEDTKIEDVVHTLRGWVEYFSKNLDFIEMAIAKRREYE